jgi:hypothetical protein
MGSVNASLKRDTIRGGNTLHQSNVALPLKSLLSRTVLSPTAGLQFGASACENELSLDTMGEAEHAHGAYVSFLLSTGRVGRVRSRGLSTNVGKLCGGMAGDHDAASARRMICSGRFERVEKTSAKLRKIQIVLGSLRRARCSAAACCHRRCNPVQPLELEGGRLWWGRKIRLCIVARHCCSHGLF